MKKWKSTHSPLQEIQHFNFTHCKCLALVRPQGECDHSRIYYQSGMLFRCNLHLTRWSKGHSQRKGGGSHHPSSSLFIGGHCVATSEDMSLRSCLTVHCYSMKVQITALLLPANVILSKWLNLSRPQFLHLRSGDSTMRIVNPHRVTQTFNRACIQKVLRRVPNVQWLLSTWGHCHLPIKPTWPQWEICIVS